VSQFDEVPLLPEDAL